MKTHISVTLPATLILLLLIGCSSSGSSPDSGETFASGTIAADGTFSYTFNEEGLFEYYCDIHDPDMQGTVNVSTGVQNTNPDTVEMINTQFVPSQISVAPNTEVVWINRDNMNHTVVSGNPSTGQDGGGY